MLVLPTQPDDPTSTTRLHSYKTQKLKNKKKTKIKEYVILNEWNNQKWYSEMEKVG